ncbi:MAG: peptidoglycan-binding protein [Alphaproteobacteria bacterium]
MAGPSTFGKPVGRNQPNQSHDVAEVENLLDRTGHYDASLTDGSTGYFSRRLDAAIRNYQSDSNLTSDGIVAPNGPTIVSLYNEAESPARGATEVWEGSENGTVTAVAIPAIAYKIAEYFGIAVIAAWTWWQGMSPEQREGILRRIDDDETEETNREHCEDLLNYEDGPRCNDLSNKGEGEAAAMCWKSANERYSACRRGVPINELPPLNAWNN